MTGSRDMYRATRSMLANVSAAACLLVAADSPPAGPATRRPEQERLIMAASLFIPGEVPRCVTAFVDGFACPRLQRQRPGRLGTGPARACPRSRAGGVCFRHLRRCPGCTPFQCLAHRRDTGGARAQQVHVHDDRGIYRPPVTVSSHDLKIRGPAADNLSLASRTCPRSFGWSGA